MKKQLTFILSIFTILLVHGQTITTVEGVYGGRINAITGGKIGTGVLSDSLRIVVATESANSLFYADVKASAFGSISKVNSFTVLPSADASIGLGSNIRRIAYHKESEKIYFVNNGNLYYTSITDPAATAVPTGGGIIDVAVHNNKLYYLSAVGANNTFYYSTIDATTGTVTAVSNTTVNGYAFTALVKGHDSKLYAFKEGSAPKALQFGGDFTSGIDFATTTIDAMAVPTATGYSWSAMGVYNDGTVYVGGTNGGTNPYKYVANTSSFGSAYNIVNTNITGTSGYNIEFRTGTFGSVYVYFGSTYSPSAGAAGTWVLIGNTGFETHPNDGSVFLLNENSLTNKGNILMTTDQGLGLSENSGASIHEIDDGILATQVYDFDMNKDKSFGWLAGKDGVRYVSDYSGSAKRWSTSIFPNGDGSPYFSAEMVDDSTTAYVGNVRLYRTSDKGTSWSQIFTAENAPYNYPQVGSQIQAIAISDSLTNIVMIGYKNTNSGQKGGVFYTLDGGLHWSQLYIHTSTDGQDVNVNDIEIVSDSGKIVAYIGVDYDNTVSPIVRGMYKAQYDGSTWSVRSEEIYGAPTSLFSVMDIVIPSKDTIIATGGFYNPVLHHEYGINFMISRPVLNTWHSAVNSTTRTSGHTACSWNVDTFFYAYSNSIYYDVITFGYSATGHSGEGLYATVPVGTEINVLYYDELLAGTASDFRSIRGATAAPVGDIVWTAAANTTSWTNGDNWSFGRAPVATDDVTIGQTGSNMYPVLTSSVTVHNLKFDNNTNINTGGPNNVNITGDVAFSNSQISGNLTMNGTSAQTIAGIVNLNFLTINNTAGVTIYSGSQNKVNILNQLSLQGGTLYTNNNLTLKSTSLNNTALVAPVIPGAAVSGNVTVERYITKGYRNYRDLAPSVANAGSIFSNWQENGASGNYGFYITGPAAKGAAGLSNVEASSGLDYTYAGLPSMYTLSGTTWSAITTTKGTNLDPFRGYRGIIRGARNFNMNTNPNNMPTATTLRTTGKLITGDVNITLSGSTADDVAVSSSYGLSSGSGTFSLIANPYACPIDWSKILGHSSIYNSYYYLDPTYQDAVTGYQRYITVQYNRTTHVTTVIPNPKGGSANDPSFLNIESGQAIMVNNYGAATPAIKIKESDKVLNSSHNSVFGATTTAVLSINLNKTSNGVYTNVDAAAVVFDNAFSKSNGEEDTKKLFNGGENIYIAESSENLSIDGLPLPVVNDVISIQITQLQASVSYDLKLDVSQYLNQGTLQPFILDNATGIEYAATSTVTFTPTADPASYKDRFRVIFKNITGLAVKFTTVKAFQNEKKVTVSWTTANEEKISQYEVEKSTDGKDFTSYNTQSAKNTITASYNWNDEAKLSRYNYYRIKVTEMNGKTYYSNIVLIKTANDKESISVYPNPVVDKVINLQMAGLSKGKYSIALINNLGQEVHATTINYQEESSVSEAINVNRSISAGMYYLVVRDEAAKIVYRNELFIK